MSPLTSVRTGVVVPKLSPEVTPLRNLGSCYPMTSGMLHHSMCPGSYVCVLCSQVDKIIDQLQQFIQNYDLAGLKDYWGYLDRRLFCRLEDVYRPTVSKLRTSLFRYYLVHTIQVNYTWSLLQRAWPEVCPVKISGCV